MFSTLEHGSSDNKATTRRLIEAFVSSVAVFEEPADENWAKVCDESYTLFSSILGRGHEIDFYARVFFGIRPLSRSESSNFGESRTCTDRVQSAIRHSESFKR